MNAIVQLFPPPKLVVSVDDYTLRGLDGKVRWSIVDLDIPL